MTSTTGQIQIQFNWIFVIIIGSVLLIFFFALINTESKTNEDRISISQSRYFETVLSATGQKSGTLKEYAVPQIVVEFECNENTQSYGYSVQGLPSRDTTYDIIFTREELIGDDIQTWTQNWQVPFSAGTFLYITNSKQGYVFYNYSDVIGLPDSTTNFELLYSGFPSNISVDVVDEDNTDWDEVNGRNYESYTYIFLKGEEPEEVVFPSYLKDTDITILVVEPADDTDSIYEFGKVHYFDISGYEQFLGLLARTPDEEKDILYDDRIEEDYTRYLGKASLYGTAFSQNKQIYECNMKKAFTRLHLVTKLYELRTQHILDDYDLSPNCRLALGMTVEEGIIPYFPVERLSVLNNEILPVGFSNSNMVAVYDIIQDLADNNQFILGLSNCPAIY